MVRAGGDLQRRAIGVHRLSQQGGPLRPVGAGALVLQGGAKVVLRCGPMHRMVRAGADLQRRTIGVDRLSQQRGPLRPVGADAFLLQRNTSPIFSSRPEPCILLAQCIREDRIKHVAAERQAATPITQPVVPQDDKVAQDAPPRRFKRINTAKAVSGGTQNAIGLIHPPPQQRVVGAQFGGFGGFLQLDFLHPAQQLLDLLQINPLNRVARRHLQVRETL